MKCNNKIVLIIITIFTVFILSIIACSKTGGNKNDSSSADGSGESSNNGSVYTQINDGGASGIYVTVKNINDYESGTFSLAIKNNVDTPMNLAWASVYGVELDDGLEAGSLDIYLENSDGPWNKPGEYYIFLFETDQFGYYYTNGKSIAELGIEDYPKSDADYKKLPKYNLRTKDNIIDFQKQILFVRKPQSHIEGIYLHGN